MSTTKQRSEAARWLATAREDYRAAQKLRDSGMFAHAGFLAQQAAEKAVKAVHFAQDLDPWGHSVLHLLEALPGKELAGLRARAIALDKLYIPTRYPDALPGLTPSEAFTDADADDALAAAEAFLGAVEPLVA